MITLLTGSPGAAKTLYTVDKLVRPLIGTTITEQPDPDAPDATWTSDDPPPPIEHKRVVYTNVNRFLLDHVLIDKAWLERLHQHAHDMPGALVVFDEVQRVWPNRPAGSKKPEAVEFLETHRHAGIDIILITQNPQLLDPAVRALVGRHLHVRKIAGLPLAIIYEWDGCSNSLNFKSSFSKTPYRYNPSIYGLYKSARLHTPVKRKLPFAVWLMLAGLGGAAYMWPTLIHRITGKGAPVAQNVAAPGHVDGANSSMPAAAAYGTSAVQVDPHSPEALAAYNAQFRPRHAALPHSAPRYDELTRPQVVPYPAICAATAKTCRCYTEQGTRLDVPEDACRTYSDRGFFVDWQKSQQHVQPAQQQHATPQPMAEAPRDVTGSLRPSDPHDADLIAWVHRKPAF